MGQTEAADEAREGSKGMKRLVHDKYTEQINQKGNDAESITYVMVSRAGLASATAINNT